MTQRSKSSRSPLQPLDRLAAFCIVVLMGVIGLLLLGGNHTLPRVRDFSWQGKQVGAEDTAFLLTFSRPMDQASVERSLKIDPPLPGKVSWAGRRMAYTLDMPAPYGTDFTVTLEGGRDRFSSASNNAKDETLMQPFAGKFRSRDRAFVYLGVEGDEAGRLMLNNLSTKEALPLTPRDLTVMDYEPYPEGDRILFSAVKRDNQEPGGLEQQLYTVTTGIHVTAPASSITELKAGTRAESREPQPAGVVELVLDNKDYQNLNFDLSPDGQIIIVQRVYRPNPAQIGLWTLQAGQPPKPLETEPGGEFLIAPDSASLAMAQGEGMAILPLQSNAEPLDFLPKFGMVLSFARDGSAAAMVKFNRDPYNPTRSLFLVTSQGTEKELLKTNGSILTAQFDPTKTLLYCLVTRLLPGDAYLEQPFLTALNLKTGDRTDLLLLPVQRDIQVSLAPDGLGLLFDQVVSAEGDTPNNAIQGSDGKAIASSQLWFLPLQQDAKGNPVKTSPEDLPLKGLRPRWLP